MGEKAKFTLQSAGVCAPVQANLDFKGVRGAELC